MTSVARGLRSARGRGSRRGACTPATSTFAYLTDAGGDGPLALCLHGFPDTAHTWRHLLPALAERRLPRRRAVHPGLRADGGARRRACTRPACWPPTPTRCTRRSAATATPCIIGHDWGALATYGAADHEPDRWARVVGLAVPPGPARRRGVRDEPRPAAAQLVHVLLPAPAGRPRRAGRRLRLHRPAVGGVVTRLRRHRGPALTCRQSLARPGQPAGGARLLPGHARRRPRSIRGSTPTQAATEARAPAADALPARPRRRLRSASRWPKQRRR